MGHNFVLLSQGTDLNEFSAESIAAGLENNYVPPNSDSVIVHTELVGGGESTSITFDAPAKGTYTFVCSFPGHFAAMQGDFVVN